MLPKVCGVIPLILNHAAPQHLQHIDDHFKRAKHAYDQGESPLEAIRETVCLCIQELNSEAESKALAFSGHKKYEVFQEGTRQSRPYLPSLYLGDVDVFNESWHELLAACDAAKRKIKLPGRCSDTATKINCVLYTAVGSFSFCYDIWRPKSRKTPGTFFEVLMGSWLAQLLPHHTRTKFVQLPDSEESVSTDIVFSGEDLKIFVFPVKITTRERIVQPFAHQRILDSVFGVGRYESLLLCMSETQRDDKDASVNEICVPGTIRLFQKHLAAMGGIYYLDPPSRYLQKDVTDVIEIKSLGDLFASALARKLAK